MKNSIFTTKKLIQIRLKWYSLLTDLFCCNHFSTYKLKYGSMLLTLAVAGSFNHKIYGNSNENPPSPQDEIETLIVLAPTPEQRGEERIFKAAEVQPKFPGGADELRKYIYDNLRYPEDAAEQGIEGRVTVQFVVNKIGKITNVKVLQSVHPSCDKEAIRLIESMPDWIPGENAGKLVDVYFTIPIRFRLPQ